MSVAFPVSNRPDSSRKDAQTMATSGIVRAGMKSLLPSRAAEAWRRSSVVVTGTPLPMKLNPASTMRARTATPRGSAGRVQPAEPGFAAFSSAFTTPVP